MILPVFGEFHGFIDLSEHKFLFYNLQEEIVLRNREATRGGDSHPRIVAVGNYVACYLPTLEAFDSALKDKEFQKSNLKDHIKTILRANYGDANWGFAIFKLVKPGGQHPIGFLSKQMNLGGVKPFDSLFIPTRHAHGVSRMEDAIFDHNIFAVNFAFGREHILDMLEAAELVTGLPIIFGESKAIASLRGSPMSHVNLEGEQEKTFEPEQPIIVSWIKPQGQRKNDDIWVKSEFRGMAEKINKYYKKETNGLLSSVEEQIAHMRNENQGENDQHKRRWM